MSEDLQPVRQRKQEERTRDTTYPPAPEPLAVAVADSHCHLDIRDGQTWLDVGQALDMAAAVGVNRIVQIGCDLPSARWSVEAANSHSRVLAAVALHPNEAPRLADLGELDVPIIGVASSKWSQKVFRENAEKAIRSRKPMVDEKVLD